MSGSMSFVDKNRKYEEMLKKIQNPGEPSTCWLDSRLGITANRINSTLSTQQFYETSDRSLKQRQFYKPNGQYQTQSEFSMAQSTKENIYHPTTTGKLNCPRGEASTSQKSFPQDKATNEFCSAPSISGSLQYTPSESFVFKVPVQPKAYKSTKDNLAHDKYMTRINLNLQLLRPEHKVFMKFMASLVESATVACTSLQGHEQIPDFNYAEMYNSVGRIFLQQYGQTSSKKCFSDASSVTTNSTFYNNDLRSRTAFVPLHRVQVSSELSRSRLQSQMSGSRRSQSHSPRREKTASPTRAANRKRSLSQASEERDGVEESSLSLFGANNSRIAQLRDQRALQEAQAVKQASKRRSQDNSVKSTPLPKSKSNMRTNAVQDRNINLTRTVADQDKPSFEVPAGAKGVSRTGRPVKSPVKWWEQGKNESKLNNTVAKRGTTTKDEKFQTKARSSKTIPTKPVPDKMNESIVLRNNKVVGKSPVDLENSKKVTPPTTTEKVEKPAKKKYQRKIKNDENGVKKSQSKKKTEDKENCSIEKKPGKVPNPSVKKVKEEQKGKSSKRVDKKRKSEDNVSKNAKRKKHEEQSASLKKVVQTPFNYSLEDDIFGNGYKKTTRPFISAVSPTMGMLSAKKDAAAYLSKETPPCKSMAQFMNFSCHSATSSYHPDETAKQDAVVKRVTQKVKTQKNDKLEKKVQNQVQNRKVAASQVLPSVNPISISVVLGDDTNPGSDDDVSDFPEDDDLI